MQLPKIYANQQNKGKIDLTLSVNPLGCSPYVLEQLATINMSDINSYPNTEDFVSLLAKRYKVKKTNILLGCGSEQLIKLIAQTFCRLKKPVLVERGSFALFTKESLLAGATVKQVNLKEIPTQPRPQLIFIANPKTPTGELIEMDFIRNLVAKVAPALVVVDEANGEFMDESFIQDALKSTNALVLRTFSKILGLAGLRIGMAIGPRPLIENLTNAQQPFPVSQVAVNFAVAALTDQDFIEKTKQFIATERKFVTRELRQRGLDVSNSVTNNLFVRLPRATRVVTELAKRDVSVIDGSFFPGMEESGFRISLKDRQTNRIFLQKLDEVIALLRN